MEPVTGEAVPAAVLRAELCGGDPAAAARGLAALARAQAAGADVSALAAECLPRLALSDELPLPARRMACDVLRHCALSGTRFPASNPRAAACAPCASSPRGGGTADAEWEALAVAAVAVIVSEARLRRGRLAAALLCFARSA
jgi:hypothetical protein